MSVYALDLVHRLAPLHLLSVLIGVRNVRWFRRLRVNIVIYIEFCLIFISCFEHGPHDIKQCACFPHAPPV